MAYDIGKSFRHFNMKDEETLIEREKNRALSLICKSDFSSMPKGRAEVLKNAVKALRGEPGSVFSITGYAASEMKNMCDEDIPRYIYHRYRYVIYPAEYLTDAYPPCLQIEVSSVCNFKCRFCYHSDENFGNDGELMGVMSFELFKRVIDQAEGNIDFITIASRGEPLIAPDFADMLKYASGKFLSVKINTNASLLNEDKIDAILSSGVNTVVFSVDAADKELYEEYRVNGRFEDVFANIKLFNEIRRKRYPDSKILARVSGVLFDEKRQDADEITAFWSAYADQVAFVNYSPWEKIYDAEPNNITSPCSDLWRRMFVWHNGEIGICDYDYRSFIKIGNISDKSLSELWRSPEYENIRMLHLNKKRCELEPCRRCVVK